MSGDSSCKLTDYMTIPRYVGTIVEKMFPGPAHSDEGERNFIIGASKGDGGITELV